MRREAWKLPKKKGLARCQALSIGRRGRQRPPLVPLVEAPDDDVPLPLSPDDDDVPLPLSPDDDDVPLPLSPVPVPAPVDPDIPGDERLVPAVAAQSPVVRVTPVVASVQSALRCVLPES
jgi:hypothetical protein